MKKVYLLKSFATLALALVAVSCNKYSFDQEAYQRAKEDESNESFMNNVMGGQEIDPNQTWKTTSSVNITVTPRKDGILKVYTANPIGNVVAPLYTTTATAGKAETFTVARPSDVQTLYAAVLDSDGLIADQLAFDATDAEVAVDMTIDAASTRAVARRAQDTPQTPGYAKETNPIAKPSTKQKTVSVNDMPTASNAQAIVNYDVTTNWNYNYQETVYIGPNVTFTIGNDYDGFKDGAKIYMARGSKIVASGKTLSLGYNTVLYNDGGTIEAKDISLNGSILWNKGTITLSNGMWYSANNAAYVYNSGNISAYNGCSLNKNGILWNEGTFTSANGNLASDAADNKETAPYIYNSGSINANDLLMNKYLVLWNDGTVTARSSIKCSNDETQIYNAKGHTITGTYFELGNNNQLLWNDGTVTITGAINTTNSGAAIMNHGTLNAASYGGSAGIKFYNATDCVVNISGETLIKNSNSYWVNDGIFNSGTFVVNSGGNNVFNNCRLNVAETFYMGNNDGSRFILQGDASVICNDFVWNGDNYFWMGGGSIVKVANELKFNNDDWGYGFYNTKENTTYSIISAKKITTDYPNGQWRAWYEGKIYVDADSHFDPVKINDGQRNMYTTEDVVFTKKQGTAPVKWTESTCRPGYDGKDPDPDPILYYYYAFEDLGAIGDFDFNDVVLRLSAPENGTSTVELVAAGGTLPVQVIYGTGQNPQQLGNEVHKEFGVDVKTMVNTGDSKNGAKKANVILGTINVDSDADMSNLPFGITVEGNDQTSVKVVNEVNHKGTAPLMIVVAGYTADVNGITEASVGKWFWARERVNISEAYTKFGAWGANVQSNKDWYYYFTEGKVWKY